MSVKAKAFLPLSEPMYLILLSLIEPMHGYGVMQNVREITDGQTVIGPGTLYGALTSLQSSGLIASADDVFNEGGRRRRKVYSLTQMGLEVAHLEQQRLTRLARLAEERLCGKWKDGGDSQ